MVIADGADEVDMVLNYHILKSDMIIDPELIDEVQNLVEECHNHTNKDNEPIILKVIVESGLLNDKQTEIATHICLEAGADFIKTSTGMVAVGAELDKVQIMKRIIQEERSDMKIKASGGIKTMGDLQKFDPLVDRFGVGFTAVDSIFGNEEKSVGDGY
jgi:deoxyribose-phosphate aldolase